MNASSEEQDIGNATKRRKTVVLMLNVEGDLAGFTTSNPYLCLCMLLHTLRSELLGHISILGQTQMLH